jgi:hypothetical protein
MVPVPIGLGFVLSMALRELYVRQGGTFETEKPQEWENAEEQENAEPEAENEFSDTSENEQTEDNADKEVPAAEPPSVNEGEKTEEENITATTPNVDESATLDEKNADGENVETNPAAEVKAENKPRDVFSESGITPQVHLHIGNAIADMLDDVNPVVPADLSERLEEVSATEPEPPQPDEDEYDDYDDDWGTPPHADDISSHLDDLIILEKTEGDEGREDISPLAVEVLGEDFDFDSLMKQPTEKMESGEWTEESEQPAECQLSPDDYEADTTEIIPVFDVSMIENSIISPEPVDDAEELCFSEASRPMFVKRIRT